MFSNFASKSAKPTTVTGKGPFDDDVVVDIDDASSNEVAAVEIDDDGDDDDVAAETVDRNLSSKYYGK
jgi:hypothetical protein